MKKFQSLLGLVVITFVMSDHIAAAEIDAVELTEVGGIMQLNGRYFDVVQDSFETRLVTNVIISTLFYVDGGALSKLYPDATIGDIKDAVKLYYDQNPLQKGRPIVEVILAGCK